MRPLSACVRRLLQAMLGLSLGSAWCCAQHGWVPPTPAEMAMTSVPEAPGAPAIVLSYEETDDADGAEVLLHVRMKVLTAGGLDAGTVEVPDRIISNDSFERRIAARTIHADGTIIEYKATPQNSKLIDGGSDWPRRVISLPSVEVGSILEYTCHFAGQNNLYTYLVGLYAPYWRVQSRYFTRSAHFLLKLPGSVDTDTVRWVAHLAPGAQPVFKKGRVTLDLTDIPPAPNEDFMPPTSSILYGVSFFYFKGTRDKYWGSSGAQVDDQWFDFVQTRKPIVAAARELAKPGDTDEQKLHKIYDAVQKLDNTDLSREHVAREDKHVAANSEDIWLNKRGSSSELALLFVALARAAGYTAYPMAVSSRDHAIFSQDVLSWSQMDSVIAIVEVKGKELYFDPGTRLCTFAELAPWHTNIMGVSTEAKMIKIRLTPPQPFASIRTDRAADLTLAADGSVTGTVKIAYTNNAGLSLRRLAVREDKKAVETALEKEFAAEVPSTVALKLESVQYLDDETHPLLATFSVTGSLGLATSKRLVLPVNFFASQSKPVLGAEIRVTPVAFPAPYLLRDQVTLHYPAGMSVEALPARKTLNLGTDVVYDEAVVSGKNTVAAQRTFVLSKVDYPVATYPALRKFFSGVADADREQLVLTNAPAKATP